MIEFRLTPYSLSMEVGAIYINGSLGAKQEHVPSFFQFDKRPLSLGKRKFLFLSVQAPPPGGGGLDGPWR